MSMIQEPKKNQSGWKPFVSAFTGLKTIFNNERNFRIHLLFAVLALLACLIFHVTASEWIAVLLLISIVLCAEVVNTCIEYMCDLINPHFDPNIKKIKDIAAASVLICAIVAIIAGCIIFIPYLLDIFL